MDVIDSEGCDIVKKLQIEFKDHDNLSNRLKKTLYYGRLPNHQRSSLPLTEVTVELFAKAVPKGKLDIVGVDFAASISRQACISPCSLMLALVYLEQLRHKNPEYLQTVSSCDLFLVSMLVASKYLFDDGEEEEVFNDEWAASARMETKELNKLERSFLSAMNWELYVKPQTFYETLCDIENRIAHWEGGKRGWLTFTDVHVLTQKDWLLAHYWNIIVEDIIKVIVVSSLAYISAIATLMAATTISHRCSVIISSSTASYFQPTQNLSLLELTNVQLTPLCSTSDYSYENWHSSLTNRLFSWSDTEPKPQEVQLVNRSSCTPEWPTQPSLVGFFATHKMENFWAKLETNKFSIWNSFQYWPTCCGGVNSFLV